jgi:hypothetical protein
MAHITLGLDDSEEQNSPGEAVCGEAQDDMGYGVVLVALLCIRTWVL